MEEQEITKTVEDEIIEILDRIRPFIQRDGGDLRFDRFEDGVVYIRLFGACLGCASIDATLYDGIESILKDEIPEVVRVEALNAYDDIEEELESTEDDIENN